MCSMINIENHIGNIYVSEKYLTDLVRHTVTGCFGVAGICSSDTVSRTLSAISGGKICRSRKGIQIRTKENNGLVINLHIKVSYGTNINAAVKSITHKVGFTVEEALGIAVEEVNVFVDEMNN